MSTPALSASILLIAYRAADTIRAAIDGALAQTVPCEIIVSVDASPDDTYAIALSHVAGYRGPHRVTVRRSEHNRGLAAHLSDLMALASGDVFVVMAGDDIAYPQRVARTLDAFASYARIHAVGSACDEIDLQGTPGRRAVRRMPGHFDLDYFVRAGKLSTLLGATIAVRRAVFDRFGPLVASAEDNILTLRAALLGGGVCLAEPLVQYRQNPDSLGNWIFARGEGTDRFRKRYERTIRMYRDVADDLERAARLSTDADPRRLRIAREIVALYRTEADARAAILDRPRREWIEPIWRGLHQRGLRRKSLERALKLFLPRRWFGRGS
jgi:glycosyltransferase involved in cell wall biosynthesis